MSEQKYYVFLSPLNNGTKPFYQLIKHGFMGELVSFVECKTKNKDGRYENRYSIFTKSELAEIMDGALYKQTLSGDVLTPDHVYYGSGQEIVEEWINPLIELVPVEDGE